MRAVLIGLLFVATACAAHPSSSTPATPAKVQTQFSNPEAVRSYWGRMVQLYDSLNVIDASDPDLKICLINGAMRLTTPDMGAAIERYLSQRTKATLDAAGTVELKTHRNGILGSQVLIENGTCASPSKDSVRYSDVTDVQSFWIRAVELKYAGFGFVYAPDPGVRHCHAESATHLTTPEMKAAIERFVADKTGSNMDAVLAAERKSYPSGLIESDPYLATGQDCMGRETDKVLARLAHVQTRHAFLEEFARMGSEQLGEPIEFSAPAIVDCLATAAEAAYSNAYLFAIDRYVADKTRANWDQIVATDPLAPMSSVAELNKASSVCRK